MIIRIALVSLLFLFSQASFADSSLNDDSFPPLTATHASDFVMQRKGGEASDNKTILKMSVELQTSLFGYEKIGEETVNLYEAGESTLTINFKGEPHQVVFKIRGRKLDFVNEDESVPAPALWALQVVRVDFDNGKPYSKSKKTNFITEEKQIVQQTFGGIYHVQFRNFRITFSI